MNMHDIRDARISRAANRRGPYALRACDACRRRKGKCDGNQPCGHCVGRERECHFSSTSSTAIQDHDDMPGTEQRRDQMVPTARDDGCDGSLVDLVASLQRQLDNLASRVNSSAPPNPHANNLNQGSQPIRVPLAAPERPNRLLPSPSPTSLNFCGPTSPDYSLNMAQMKLRQRSNSHSLSRQKRPALFSMDDEVFCGDGDVDEAYADGGLSQTSTDSRRSQRAEHFKLLYFRSILGTEEALKLLRTYQEVVGDFHPVVNMDELTAQAQKLCSGPGLVAGPSENDLLILNLALAIALRAESMSATTDTELALQAHFQDALNAKLAAPATSIKDVVIVLLAGMYHFFQDQPRCAWRMCGTAGRLLMELGFHNGEVSKHILTSDIQRREAAIVTTSVVVLDRQWSASTGLPHNFQDSSFDAVPHHLIKVPYINAMLAFLIISDKFAESISRAAKGDLHDDCDTYEMMNFQLEQWRKKNIGSQSPSQIRPQLADPSTRPPSWVILLTLRAESVRTLLLRPFFFPKTDEKIGDRHFRPALDLVSNVVHTLYALDTDTHLYRMQRPFFQHVLASACALFFLLVTYVERKCGGDLNCMPEHLDCFGTTFQMAFALATKYASVSRASRRLGKRLYELRETLNILGLENLHVPPARQQTLGTFVNQSQQQSSYHAPPPPAALDRRNSMNQFMIPQEYPHNGEAVQNQADFQGFTPPTDRDRSFQTGWAESILFDWPMAEQEAMFGLRQNPC